MAIKIAAFGALNQDSYDMFAERLKDFALQHKTAIDLASAGPYPNKEAVSEPGRPLRAEALENETKKQELLTAVAADARKTGAETADIRVMPCMSMIGFHDGIEAQLGQKILRLSDALIEKYKSIDKVGIIHMRPAKKRVEEMFGAKAVTPDEVQAEKLLVAEGEAKKIKSTAPVEAVMKEIVEDWKAKGIKHILFARADAPKAQKGPAGGVSGVEILSYFDILAEAVVTRHLQKTPCVSQTSRQCNP